MYVYTYVSHTYIFQYFMDVNLCYKNEKFTYMFLHRFRDMFILEGCGVAVRMYE